MTDLVGKRALVCGASQGIGRATAIELAGRGCQILALARTTEKLDSLIKELPGDGHRAIGIDISDRNVLSKSIAEDIEKFGPLEILICNTGGPKSGPIVEAEDSEFVKAFENHVLVNSLLVKLLLPGMNEKSYGRIINVISTSVKIPIANLGVSNTIRGAVASWAKTLSIELGPQGITVNNVLPGYTLTPRLENLIQAAAKKQNKTISEIETAWKNLVPLRRFARPEETAAAIGFLVSPSAAYITGVSLPVDGGRTGAI